MSALSKELESCHAIFLNSTKSLVKTLTSVSFPICVIYFSSILYLSLVASCLDLSICSIIELSDRYEQALIKPPKLTIREFRSAICVEYLLV